MNMVVDTVEERASVCAEPTPSRSTDAPAAIALPKEFLTFRLGSEEYGIDIQSVQEIRSYETTTRIANSPLFIKGVVNLRGVIVPIIDLRLRLGCETADYTEFTVVIVLNVRHRTIGVVVDSVSDVLELGRENIKPAPPLSSTVDAEHIIGMGCIRSGDTERMLILTDIVALLSAADMGLMGGEPALAAMLRLDPA